ncbi:alpha/beta fold hydrolase [Actinoplanes sp. NPDC051343]|uniref:alpha/beta fold hydrolase n=1 Tax=Actinoplanes sp. NPDC051343 TaxID=3363906 RepID=UPI0037B16897
MIGNNEAVVTEMMLPVNGIEVCASTFGERSDPAVLLIGGAACSMDWWADEFCRRLAAGGRYVIRYDHRDTGRTTSFPVGDPGYSGVDLAHDALGVLDALHIHRAHLVGQSLGGMLAQRIALDRPHRVLSLTLISTSRGPRSTPPTSPQPSPSQSPSQSPAASQAPPPLEKAPEQPDWTDRRATVDHIVESVRSIGGAFTAEEPQLRRMAERVFDRTNDMAASQTNHFIAEPGPPYRDRLGELKVPTLVLHGTQDPFFTPASAEALAAAIPGAKLIWLEGVGHEYAPEALWPVVLEAILSQPR